MVDGSFVAVYWTHKTRSYKEEHGADENSDGVIPSPKDIYK